MSLLQEAARIARSAIPMERIEYGPWSGSMRSVAADRVPKEYAAAGSNFLYLPRSGHWKRRNGQTVKFDTLSSGHAAVGLLPAAWSAKARWVEEYLDESALCDDSIPTISALVSRETVSTGLDDGRFSNWWIRNQNTSAQYTWGSEFGMSVYPVPGSIQAYRIIPLRYDSGDGGITRGVDEFSRRFFFGGGRRFQKVGRWTYFPSLLGTPSRNLRRSEVTDAAIAGSNIQATSDLTPLEWDTYPVNGGARFTAVATADDSTNFIGAFNDQGRVIRMGTASIPLSTTFTVSFRARKEGTMGAGAYIQFRIYRSDGSSQVSSNILMSSITTSWADYSTVITFTGAETPDAALTNRIEVGSAPGAGPPSDGYHELTYISIAVPTSSGELEIIRTMPSGPIPPVHAGTLIKGDAATTVNQRPDATVAAGSFLTNGGAATLHLALDETTASDADYITSNTVSDTCTLGMSNFAAAPGATDTVTVRFRARRGGAGTTGQLLVELLETAVSRASATKTITGGFNDYSFVLTAAEVATVGNWDNARLKFTSVSGMSGLASCDISYATIEDIPAAAGSEGGWKGKDRFLYSMAYRFEDDSIWMPCTPRLPNDILATGYNLFTVDATNPEVAFGKVTWRNLPVGPFGTKRKLLLRTPKIDTTSDDDLLLNPFDLRVVAEIDNDVVTYDDYLSEDLALVEDPENLFIRYDHIMPPRARHIFAGDSRVCHGYGGLNPCAIEIAPVGFSVDYDRTGNDNTSALYASGSQFMHVIRDPTGTNGLALTKQTSGGTVTSETLAFATYNTLQKLVDRINLTTATDSGGQWRAQLCPGVNPDADPVTALAVHKRLIQNCVVSGQTISKAAGGLSDVAVGAFISGTGVTAGAYISIINSDTLLTFVGTITAATKDLTFYFDTGDTVSSVDWYQRVIANSLPGFLYFANDYLEDFPVDKSAVYMTVGSPGATKSAPNCFSGKIDNVHRPPADAGICMGGAGVDNGFVVVFSKKLGAIRNERDTGSGLDQDYRLILTNESRGGCAFVVPGNRCALFMSGEGVVGADLYSDDLLSEPIFVHAPTAKGDFDYELPLCVAAAAADTDTAYAMGRVMKGALWVNYRDSSNVTAPDRQVCYDFESRIGLKGLRREDGSLYGWSLELARAMTAMGEGRRSDGLHMYGWNDANGGSTGDGRIDEMETSDTDNGTAIDGSVELPWFTFGDDLNLSAQKFHVRHNSPAGSTGQYIFHRSLSDESYTLTPSTGSTIYTRDVKELTLPARATTAACFFAYRQQTGGAREWRRLVLLVKRLAAPRPTG